jgi:hypothetical protein
MPGGRPPKPLRVLEMSGATREHPGRYRTRKTAQSRIAAAGLGPPPVEWLPHPKAAEAVQLFEAGKDAYAVAAALGISWDVAKSLRPEAPPSREAALLKIWNEIVAQDILRVLNISHRILVKNTCQLQYKVDRACAGHGRATSGDYAQIKSNLAAMGMTPVDSPRVAEAVRVPDRGSSGKPASGWGELVG